ncbi:MAG TPA: helix-turn-helix domain-containing protein [Sphingobacteriaceae bacterium]
MAKKVPFYPISRGDHGKAIDFSIAQQDVHNEELPHRHDHYLIYFVEEGASTHSLDFEEYRVEAPALLFVTPGQIHSVEHAGHSKVTALAFNASFTLGMDINDLEHLFHTSVIRLQAGELAEVHPYIELMQREYSEIRGKEPVLAGLLTAFLAKCELIFHKYHDAGREHYDGILQQFIILIDENFKTITRVADYADRLFLTAGHLNDIVKQVTGKSAKSFIDQRRILEARRLLYWTGSHVKSIAWELGFEDPAYFARWFKKHTGELPKNFQLRVKNQPHN